jgi:AcrR family transcriptional regulator
VNAGAAKTRTPTQPRAQQTRAALLEAAEREFAKHGYAATTAKTIAARAKSATGSFYQYFASKDEALHEIARACQTEIVEHALAALEGAPDLDGASRTASDVVLDDIRRRMRTIVDVTIAFHTGHRGLHAVLAERRHVDHALDAMLRAGERRMVDRITELLRRWGHGGDVEATAYVLFAAVRGAVLSHVGLSEQASAPPQVDDARFVAATVDALIRIALPVSFIGPSIAPPRAGS